MLTGTGSYTGDTNINGGTMQVNGDISASDALYVNPGATLAGIGTVPAINVGGDGTVAPGDGGPGILSAGGFGMSPGSTASFDIDGPTAGSGYSQVVVSGSNLIVIDSGDLELNFGYTPAIGTQLTLISNATGQGIIGSFGNVVAGEPYTDGNVTYVVSYTGGEDGHDVVLTVTDVTYTWSGGDVDSSNWSLGDNWVGDVAPTPGARLIFPSDASARQPRQPRGRVQRLRDRLRRLRLRDHRHSIDLSNGIITTYTTGSVALRAERRARAVHGHRRAGRRLALAGRGHHPAAVPVPHPGRHRVRHPDPRRQRQQRLRPPPGRRPRRGPGQEQRLRHLGRGRLHRWLHPHARRRRPVRRQYRHPQFLRGDYLQPGRLQHERLRPRPGGRYVLVPTGSTLTLPYELSGLLSTNSTTSQITGAGTIDLNGSTLGIYVAEDAGAGVTLNISTVMTDGGIYKDEAGALDLSAANTFDGIVEVANGTLIVQDASALGSGVGSTTVNDGATLELDSAGSIGESITLGSCMGGATLMNSGGDNDLTSDVTLVGDNTIEVNAGSLTIDGQVTGTGGFTMAGTGELTLTASNTYSGATMISAGTLDITNSGALSTSAVTVNNYATLQLDGGVTITPSSITVAGAGAAAAGALIAATGDNTYAGPITLAAAQTDIDVEAGATLDLSGDIGEDMLGRQLVSIGDGVLILGGTGSYTSGASLLGGTTVVNGSIAASPSGVSIRSGATLAGTGTVNPNLFVFSGATVAPGEHRQPPASSTPAAPASSPARPSTSGSTARPPARATTSSTSPARSISTPSPPAARPSTST